MTMKLFCKHCYKGEFVEGSQDELLDMNISYACKDCYKTNYFTCSFCGEGKCKDGIISVDGSYFESNKVSMCSVPCLVMYEENIQ